MKERREYNTQGAPCLADPRFESFVHVVNDLHERLNDKEDTLLVILFQFFCALWVQKQ